MAHEIDLPNGDSINVRCTGQPILGETVTVGVSTGNASIKLILPVASAREFGAALADAAGVGMPTGHPAQPIPGHPRTAIDDEFRAARDHLQPAIARARATHDAAQVEQTVAKLDAAEVAAEYETLNERYHFLLLRSRDEIALRFEPVAGETRAEARQRCAARKTALAESEAALARVEGARGEAALRRDETSAAVHSASMKFSQAGIEGAKLQMAVVSAELRRSRRLDCLDGHSGSGGEPEDA